MTPAAGAPAPRRPGARRRRRGLWRGVGAAIVLAGLFSLYGWRYGFRELPAPDLASIPDATTLFAPRELTQANFWYHVRAAARSASSAAARGNPTGARALGVFPRVMLPPVDPAEALKSPEPAADLANHVQAALAAPDWRPPRELRPEDWLGLEALFRHILAAAQVALEAGDAPTAYAQWVRGWHLLAAVTPATEFAGFFDERGSALLADRLTGEFRSQALHGAPLPPNVAREVLAGLTAAGRRAAPPAESYARQVSRAAGVLRLARQAEWSRVTRAARLAGMLIRRDTVSLFEDLVDRISGWQRRSEPDYHGALHLLRPLGELVGVLQTRVARAADFDRMEAACFGAQLRALRDRAQGGNPPDASTPPGLEPVTGWRHFWDRPAVWRLAHAFPASQPVLASWQQWLWELESCRLTLALRVYAETHGHWPDRLEALVPEILEAVPADPFQPGEPPRYAREDGAWLLWSAGFAEAAPREGLTRRVIRSTDFSPPGAAVRRR